VTQHVLWCTQRDGVLKKEIENLRQKNEALEVALKELAEEHDEVQAARIRVRG